jgi:PAS domain S-box-containing protein
MKQITHLDAADVLEAINSSIYWKDVKGAYWGCNTFAAKKVKLRDSNEIIGRTDHDLFSTREADVYRNHDLQIIKEAKPLVLDEEGIRENGEKFWHLSSKQPLYKNGAVVGIVGSSIDITAQKEAERFNIQKDAAQKKVQAKFTMFINKMMKEIQNYRIEELNERLGNVGIQIIDRDVDIKLTKREQEVLYFLSLNRSPKDIAMIISTLENKEIMDSTINAIINKKLYPKFNVFNVGQLIEKAYVLKLIPFLSAN